MTRSSAVHALLTPETHEKHAYEHVQLAAQGEYAVPTCNREPSATTSRMLTDMGNAARFRDQHMERARYCHPLALWYVQDGRRWKADDTGAAVRLAKKVTRTIWQDAINAPGDERDALLRWAKQSEAADRIAKMLKLAQSELPVLTDQLDTDPWLFNCRSGTIELRTGRLRGHRASDLITKLAPVDYDGEDVPAPTWDATAAATKPLQNRIEV